MRGASVNPQTETADLRWGVLFYSDQNKRVGAVYFDKWGKTGYIDDTPVSFTGGLFAWVSSSFSNWQ